MLKFLCVILLALFPTMSAWAAAAPLKVLIFSKTEAFHHASIPAGIGALEELGALHGWDVDATEDASQLNDDNLKRYDVVVWLNTSGNILDSRQKAAYERFQQSHKGTVAIHEAGTDTERDGWPPPLRLARREFAVEPLDPLDRACTHRRRETRAAIDAPRPSSCYDSRNRAAELRAHRRRRLRRPAPSQAIKDTAAASSPRSIRTTRSACSIASFPTRASSPSSSASIATSRSCAAAAPTSGSNYCQHLLAELSARRAHPLRAARRRRRHLREAAGAQPVEPRCARRSSSARPAAASTPCCSCGCIRRSSRCKRAARARPRDARTTSC